MTSSVRVALSGSGFRLPAHLGALHAIEAANRQVIELAGTSGGSIVAALYASGIGLEALRALCMTLDWAPLMRFSPWALLTRRALCTGDALLQFLYKQTPGLCFADLDIDLTIVASNLQNEEDFVFSRAATPDLPIALAARASASIPLVFSAVKVGDALLVDGGTTDNVTAAHLTVDGLPRLAIDLESTAPAPLPDASLRSVAPRIIDLMLASNEAARQAIDRRNGVQFVTVDTGDASSFDRHMPLAVRERLFAKGRAATAQALITL
ncbi:MAG: patatin-like phospholipase family protein [Janthinobacterium lividum]